MAAIFALSSQPALPNMTVNMLDVAAKKIAHFGEFAILTILIGRAIAQSRVLRTGEMLAIVALALCYALSDEIHQSFVPGRNPSAIDFAIDAIGVAAGVLLLSRWPSRQGVPLGPPTH
jgi:VanZ family protein